MLNQLQIKDTILSELVLGFEVVLHNCSVIMSCVCLFYYRMNHHYSLIHIYDIRLNLSFCSNLGKSSLGVDLHIYFDSMNFARFNIYTYKKG